MRVKDQFGNEGTITGITIKWDDEETAMEMTHDTSQDLWFCTTCQGEGVKIEPVS